MAVFSYKMFLKQTFHYVKKRLQINLPQFITEVHEIENSTAGPRYTTDSNYCGPDHVPQYGHVRFMSYKFLVFWLQNCIATFLAAVYRYKG
jgi:hypothetical protein